MVLDRALTREAEGLLADMMADPDLPRHLLSGLKAVSGLLKSTDVALIDGHRRTSPGAAAAAVTSLSDVASADCADLPYADRHVYLPKVSSGRIPRPPTPTSWRVSSPTRPTRAITRRYSGGKLNGEVA